MMREFVIEIENKPGALARVCSSLGQKKINIKAVAIDRVGSQGFVRLVTNDPELTSKTLEDGGYLFSENDVVVRGFVDEPNQLGDVATKLASQGVNIESVYLLNSKNDRTHVVFVLDDPERGARVLSQE
ncbi:MAG: hypothetical protein JW834_03065 [Candidatus Diapherotrites archaeon]|nr:hypothetical protein [Candidatus Diapherotrites archaeon]